MTEQITKKTVHVKHKKSFANTQVGGAIDAAAATALTVVVTLGTVYAVNKVTQLMEDKNVEREISQLFTKAKNKMKKAK